MTKGPLEPLPFQKVDTAALLYLAICLMRDGYTFGKSRRDSTRVTQRTQKDEDGRVVDTPEAASAS